MLKYFLIACLIFPLIGFSQVKEQNLEEIIILDLLLREKPKVNHILTREDILRKQPEDLGDLLKSFPEITLKNYGGLGGLKTISSRGINGTHTGIIVDGFLIQNVQTGQIDLSNVQVENSTEVKFSNSIDEHKLQVVSAYFNASNLFISTFENQFTLDTLQLRFTTKVGSFGQLDNYLSAKWNRNKAYVSVFGKYRQADGDFPYIVQNFNESIRQNRFNNDLQEYFAGFSFGKLFQNNSSLKFNLTHNFSDKGLPGAVILYNPTSSQRLTNSSLNANLDFRFKVKKQVGRTYLSYRYDELIYLDSAYLNTQGYLKSLYFNSNALVGSIFKKQWKNKTLVYGLEEQFAYLKSSSFVDEVNRFHEKMILELSIMKPTWIFEFASGVQHVLTQEKNSESKAEKWAYNPGISIYSRRMISMFGMVRINLKRTMRMPSFNELYYSQIGNVDLKPEIANQSAFGSDYKFNIHNNNFKITYNLFFNYIENKIVAIPTKNLFIWSIQNVGKVVIYGSDVVFSHERRFNDTWSLNTNVNYTFQRVMDYSNKNATTFQDQIAYMPLHLLNANFSCDYKKVGINISGHYTSLRFALNENIVSNEVPSFYTFDASIYARKTIKANEFRLSFSIKNLSNNSYEYIRNYVMPGRSYLISLSYALH